MGTILFGGDNVKFDHIQLYQAQQCIQELNPHTIVIVYVEHHQVSIFCRCWLQSFVLVNFLMLVNLSIELTLSFIHKILINGIGQQLRIFNKKSLVCFALTEQKQLWNVFFLMPVFLGNSSDTSRAPDNFQVQRVITPYFWKWWVFAYFLCTVVLSTSEKIAYMYTLSVIQ
jgi:hypothetical protein